ncbi:MAG: coproporphyrinogen III oxidase family protein [Planctomycetota bacterium]|nr:MAG: coproporphyrinogen III oxidase family protein [Planctomycetota bacterium]
MDRGVQSASGDGQRSARALPGGILTGFRAIQRLIEGCSASGLRSSDSRRGLDILRIEPTGVSVELDVVKQDARSEIGSVFVSNYPPYSAWSAEHLDAVFDALGRRDGATQAPLGLYLHIPFCRKRCKFCYFRVYTDKNSRDVETYMDALAREIELLHDHPRLAGRAFEFVYFGGGTPSFLSSAQLERLIERINRTWRWDAAREVTFECEPGTLKRGKIDAIKAIGVTRLSLGVEHFDDDVLEQNGRAHRSAEILRAWEWIRQADFQQVNIDLIAGLVGDTEVKWKRTVERTLALQPDSLTIYQLELPYNAVFARQALEGTTPLEVIDADTKRRWVGYAFEQFEAAGYEISSGYTVVRPGPHSAFVYRDSLWRGADMVGAGVASISHVAGVNYQNVDTWDAYLKAVAAGRLPVGRALPLTDRQRMIRELVLQTKLGRVELDYFDKKYGVDVRKEFAEPFAEFARRGFGEIRDGALCLTRAGLLRVDLLLRAYFEPQYRNVRYT